ncbi:hypothetical protein [Amphibacillus xylanus]|nr:hypothetical protein [Amphibacillus xylanus]
MIFLLVGCSDDVIEVHENVNLDLATDTLQVLDILDKAIKSGNQPNEKDQNVLDTYLAKYRPLYEDDYLENINNDIFIFTESGITSLNQNITLDSGKENMEALKISITNYIKNGDTITSSYAIVNDDDGFQISETSEIERDEFIKVYNILINGVNENLKAINANDIKAPEKDGELYWQNIHQSDVHIEVKYDKKGSIHGYHMAITEDFDSKIIYALAMNEALELDTDIFIEALEEVIHIQDGLKTIEYDINNYNVSMLDSRELGFFIFNFDKTGHLN